MQFNVDKCIVLIHGNVNNAHTCKLVDVKLYHTESASYGVHLARLARPESPLTTLNNLKMMSFLLPQLVNSLRCFHCTTLGGDACNIYSCQGDNCSSSNHPFSRDFLFKMHAKHFSRGGGEFTPRWSLLLESMSNLQPIAYLQHQISTAQQLRVTAVAIIYHFYLDVSTIYR